MRECKNAEPFQSRVRGSFGPSWRRYDIGGGDHDGYPMRCSCVQLLTIIKQQGDAQAMPADQVAAAFFALLDARQTCLREGAGAGLARYEAAVPTSEMARK